MSFRNAFVGDSGSGGYVGMVPAPGTGDANATLRGSGIWSPSGAIIAATAAIANTHTVVKRSAKLIAASTLSAGDTFRITLQGTCTSSNADTQIFKILFGTAGTTADSAIITYSIASDGSGTAIPFSAVMLCTVRTLGAAATCYGSIQIVNDVVGDGVCTGFSRVLAGTASTFDSTVASYITASYISGASTTAVTFQNAVIELI